ncbi:unnamed protein product [Rangifer tarandus platyrhynchus]|uniref:Uncharacterized protein n=2 Tax=Rangifer tarandus platyrhynchus TaxID=3082113 RepID=A0ABN8YNF0_RANTA|nr:unnamed protein product [Rangifer tarandus platyrhynchus]CAI9701072.1 unnamed protein product [Rangifer tarandus platyrhynchus]
MESPSVKCPLTSAGGRARQPPPLPTRKQGPLFRKGRGRVTSLPLPHLTPPHPTRPDPTSWTPSPLRLALTEAPFSAPPDTPGCGPVPVNECEDASNSITPRRLLHDTGSQQCQSPLSAPARRGRNLYNVCCVTYHSYVGVVFLRR